VGRLYLFRGEMSRKARVSVIIQAAGIHPGAVRMDRIESIPPEHRPLAGGNKLDPLISLEGKEQLPSQ
jgi:hypothetical protein